MGVGQQKGNMSEAKLQVASEVARIGKPAPHFEMEGVKPNGEFADFKSSDYKGKFLVLLFYPLDFTFVCPTELVAYGNKAEEFKKLNCEVLGVSVDSKFTHLAWMKTDRKAGGIKDLAIPLASDLTHKVSTAYDVLWKTKGYSMRGLFIIDSKGIIRHITKNDDPIGRSVDETLRLVSAIQFTDEHGEVCPAGWTKGAKTINTEKKEEYFSAVNP